MKQKHLLKSVLLLVLVALLWSGGTLMAQRPSSEKRNAFWLDFGAGLGITNLYDNGTIPFTYNGINNDLRFGFTDEWKRCHIHFDAGRAKTNLSDLDGVVYGIGINLDFLYSCLKPSDSRWNFWSGAAFETFIDLKAISDLGNAAAAMSTFGNLSAVELLQCNMAYSKDKSHPWLTAFFRLSLPILGLGSRPDFMYVHDPLGEENPIQLLTKHNESYFKMFPGCTTDLGFYLNLRNGNKIGLYYHWNYISSGKKGAYRYDNAFHNVNVSFMFKLNNK